MSSEFVSNELFCAASFGVDVETVGNRVMQSIAIITSPFIIILYRKYELNPFSESLCSSHVSTQ